MVVHVKIIKWKPFWKLIFSCQKLIIIKNKGCWLISTRKNNQETSVFRTLFYVKAQRQSVSITAGIHPVFYVKHCCAFLQIMHVIHWGKACVVCCLEVRQQRMHWKHFHSMERKCLIDIFWPLFTKHIQVCAFYFLREINCTLLHQTIYPCFYFPTLTTSVMLDKCISCLNNLSYNCHDKLLFRF